MEINVWGSIFSHLFFFPSAVLCYLPMKDRLKRPAAITRLTASLVVIFGFLAATLTMMFWKSGYRGVVALLLVLMYVLYHRSLTVHFSKSLAVYLFVMVFMSFPGLASVGYDAAIYPASDLEHYSTQGAFVLTGLSFLLAACIAHSMRHFLRKLINTADSSTVWFSGGAVSGYFLLLNMLMVVRHYETIHVNRMYSVYWMLIGLHFLLFVVLCFLFYTLVTDLTASAVTREKLRIMELQKEYYLSLQRHMDDTVRARHDLRHTIHMLDMLAQRDDMESIRSYLSSYRESQPQTDLTDYCSNVAVNAILNYYGQSAVKQQTEFKAEVELPGITGISDVDLCTILGNILENAVSACAESHLGKHFIHLSIRTDGGDQLVISCVNSFFGQLSKEGENYLPTHGGSGIGLVSIRTTAERLGGNADFTHSKMEFHTEVVLPLR
ncbi:MAG: GHKL domain-containing protein [Lachnospiraceae bacterium]|nr:GHKL domain-containing protein [Lachnospiraceae bacterium]